MKPLLNAAVAMAVSSAGLVATPIAQGRGADKMATVKALSCTFTTMAAGDWNAAGAVGAIKNATLSIRFTDIDADEGTAIAVGAFGPSDIIVRLSFGTLHLVQSFREGPLYATAVFPHELKPDVMRAVHTRHEYTTISLPGFTSRPEQYYGECAINK
jgi:hypothetical protein